MINKTRSHPLRIVTGALFILTALLFPFRTPAQSAPEPTREKLLNGMAILFWQRPGDATVLLKMRIHSGAAFDLTGKGGMMALLGDALFPDPATRDYVSEQLGGRLDVTTDYDSIDVTISGKAEDLERIIDLLHNAIVNIQLSPENVTKIRQAHLAKLSEKPSTTSQIADLAIRRRLLSNFPYAHPTSGTAETVQRVDRADLMLARERFLNADNATLAVIGGIDKARLMRALRQLLGPWNKSDRMVPATFRQADPPRPNVLIIEQSGAAAAEIRLAVRGLARADRDAIAASLLARIVKERWRAALPDLSSPEVRSETFALPGIFVLGGAAPNASAAKAVSAAQEVMRSLTQSGPTAAELDRARSAALAEVSAGMSPTEVIAEEWLDIETFRLASHATQPSSITSVTPADVQRVAGRLFTNAPLAIAVVGKSAELTPLFDRADTEPPVKITEKPPGTPVSPAKKP